jgi:DNA-binding response OmpR family regulator
MPVILLTGEKGESLRTEGLAAGADAFVNKPVVGPKLREAIAEVRKRRGG